MAAKKTGTANRATGGKRGSMVPLQAVVVKDLAEHHSKSQYAGAPPPRNIQQPRISTTIPPNRQSSFADPNSGGLHGAFSSPHLSSGGQPHQQSPYGTSQDPNYYASHPSPHSTASAPGHYPTAEGSDQMAATAHMQRPYPPIYHTPQSNSPASVASPQTHDQHGRSMYGQPPPQLTQPMYGYQQYSPMSQVHPSQYASHSGQQPHHHLTHPPIMQHPSSNAPMPQPHSMGQPGGLTSSSPRLRVDAMQPQQQQQHHHHQQQQLQQQPQHQPPPPQQPTPRIMQQHAPTQAPSIAANSMNLAQPATPTINASAAPGPIPATTPLVVRQDGNGVQWIAFEYSRDRVKSEYTIRCDVESVQVDSLSAEFKNENCVYPRACCGKDNYKGNRLNYETECNAVGWALAELNTCLRGKRGLIQRAVDSWRNSNQDPKLRSRRVRRQAKVQHRNKAAQQTAQLAGPSPTGVSGASASMGSSGIRASGSVMTSMAAAAAAAAAAPQLQHHHHARPEMAVPGQQDSSGEVDYSSASASAPASGPRNVPGHPISTTTDLRPGQVFTGYPAYPPSSGGGSSMAPSSYHAMDGLRRAGGAGTMTSAPAGEARETASVRSDFVPESRKRKLDEVGGQQHDERVRLGLHFHHEGGGSSISPTSYRTYSDFPRSSYPQQMPAPATARHPSRSGRPVEGDSSTVVRTVVKAATCEQMRDPAAAALSSVDCIGRVPRQSYGHQPIRHQRGSMGCGGGETIVVCHLLP